MSCNLIVILGPTATGKTRLAARLADLFDGEIISADSRQVYRFMDIGTGKDISDYSVEGKSIPYHLIDIIDPDKEYNLYQFKQDFYKAFSEIKDREKLPFLAGGTGLYLSSVIQNYKLNRADFAKDEQLLWDMNDEQLKELLFKLNPTLHNTTDLINKERLIKAIQVAKSNEESDQLTEHITPFVIGINLDRDTVKKRITERLKTRLKSGMIEEVELLLKNNVSHDKLMFFGLEYKFIGLYLNGDISYNDMFQKLNSAIHSFAKRQMTWFRKMEKEGVNINWINGPDFDAATKLIKKEFENFEK